MHLHGSKEINLAQDISKMMYPKRLSVAPRRTPPRDQKLTTASSHCTIAYLKSLLFFITVQLTQIRYSESIATTNIQQHHRLQHFVLSPDQQYHQHHYHYQHHVHNQQPLYQPNPSGQLPIDRIVLDSDSLYKTNTRKKRSAPASMISATSRQQQPVGKSVDACQSKMEVLTPYYATNSKGKVRTIVNSELMQQAIQVETCVRLTQSTTSAQVNSNRCNAQPDCGCEQKYKWHRLLVLNPNDAHAGASGGLFMDWFLFPSNCVCRCKPGSSAKHFLRTMNTT